MYLTSTSLGRPRALHDHEQLELLLESFTKQVEEIVSEIDNTVANIQSTQEIAELMLDSGRNALLALDIKISFATLGAGCAAVVAGVFGMNVSQPPPSASPSPRRARGRDADGLVAKPPRIVTVRLLRDHRVCRRRRTVHLCIRPPAPPSRAARRAIRSAARSTRQSIRLGRDGELDQGHVGPPPVCRPVDGRAAVPQRGPGQADEGGRQADDLGHDFPLKGLESTVGGRQGSREEGRDGGVEGGAACGHRSRTRLEVQPAATACCRVGRAGAGVDEQQSRQGKGEGCIPRHHAAAAAAATSTTTAAAGGR